MMTKYWASGLLLSLVAFGCSQPDMEAVGLRSPAAAQTAYEAPALQTVAAVNQYAPETTAPMAAPEPLPEDLPAVSNEAVEAITNELEGLRQEMASLRHELTGQVVDLVEELRKENEQLRQEVLRLSALAESPAAGRVPAPAARAAKEEMPEPQVEAPEPEVVAKAEPAKPKGPVAPFVFTSVKEWGRSPEDAAQSPSKASSLAGVVGRVPTGSREEDLVKLGQELRDQYDGYDNINIEVFDDVDAASQFAERSAMDPAHRVLSVSKHLASDRDVILVYRKGVALEVTENGLVPMAEKPE